MRGATTLISSKLSSCIINHGIDPSTRLALNLNILCLQEVKVIVFILNDSLDYICLATAMFQLARGRVRGETTLISPKLSSCIIDHGIDPSTRLVRVLLFLNGRVLVLAIVYPY